MLHDLTCVVYHDIHGAKASLGSRHQSLHLISLGHISLKNQNSTAANLGLYGALDAFELINASCTKNHLSTLSGKSCCDGGTDAS